VNSLRILPKIKPLIENTYRRANKADKNFFKRKLSLVYPKESIIGVNLYEIIMKNN